MRIFNVCRRAFSSGNGQSRAIFNVPNYPVEVKDLSTPENEKVAKQTSPNRPRINPDYNNVGRVRCYNCGQVGHISYDCHVPQVRKACFVCGNSGHFARDCPQRIQVSVCFSCNKTGHMSWQCPERNKNNTGAKAME